MTWLQRNADVECCDVTTTGRRTGRRHEIEIWFGVIDQTMYLISGNGPTADWFLNLRADPATTVRIDDERWRGSARVVDDPDERQRVGDIMGAKYVWEGDASIGLTYAAWATTSPPWQSSSQGWGDRLREQRESVRHRVGAHHS